MYICIGGGAVERVYMLRATRRSFAGTSRPQKSAKSQHLSVSSNSQRSALRLLCIVTFTRRSFAGDTRAYCDQQV